MANPWFRFKEFTIHQEQSAFKVGTDGVMLGSWADVAGINSVLDIGTGTGLLALMLAQRSNAEITAIEIDRPSFEQAMRNALESPWPERIHVLHSSLQNFGSESKFDMLISNPPFFQNSLPCSDKGKAASRHNTLLSLSELISCSKSLLVPEGKLCLVFPVEESRILMDICSGSGFYLHRRTGVRPTPFLPVKRYLLEFRPYRAASLWEEDIIIEKGERHDYSKEYRELTKDFYLDF